MKKLFKLTAGLALTVALFSSCLDGGNTASYSDMFGTYVTRKYFPYGDNDYIPLVRLDDGSYVYHSSLRTMSSSLKNGDRLLSSFTLDFDNQSDEAYKNKYYDASDLSVTQFPLAYAENYPTEAPANDPIEGFETAFLTSVPSDIEIPSGYLITLRGLVKGDTKEHSYKLYFDKFAQKQGEDRYDTLKFVFSHNSNGELQSVNMKRFLYSYNISPFSAPIEEAGKTSMIYIAYKNSNGTASSVKWLYASPSSGN